MGVSSGRKRPRSRKETNATGVTQIGAKTDSKSRNSVFCLGTIFMGGNAGLCQNVTAGLVDVVESYELGFQTSAVESRSVSPQQP